VAWDDDRDWENFVIYDPTQALIQKGRECALIREEWGESTDMKSLPAKAVAYRTPLSRSEGGTLDTREERRGTELVQYVGRGYNSCGEFFETAVTAKSLFVTCYL
jgi:hypothetical protein